MEFLRRAALLLLLLLSSSSSSSFVVTAASDLSSTARVQLEPGVGAQHLGRARHWKREGRVTASDVLRLQIVLRHDPAAVQDLEATLLEVSDPMHAQYGHYLGIDEVAAIVAPEAGHSEAVRAWLLSYHLRPTTVEVNRYRDVVTVHLSAPLAEEIFKTELYHFRHTGKAEARIVRASTPYSVPAHVAPYVAYVSELLRFPRVRTLPFVPVAFPLLGPDTSASFQACGVQCAGYVTPEVLAERYHTPLSLPAPCAANNSMALAEFQLEYYDRRDLRNFASTCGVESVSVDKNYQHNAAIVCTRGGGCIESLLDIEWASTAAGGGAIPLSVYYSMQYSILDWISAVNDNEEAELVHSVSYGNDEAQQVSAEYMESCNTEFMKAGVRGLSLFIASGDQGVYGREGPGNNVFNPGFPASSPWITSVGGTDFVTASVVGDEQAWDGSGGGFSNTFDMPEYQRAAVANYKMVAAMSLPPTFMWNQTGRGFPDLSALGGAVNPYCVSAEAGELAGVWGTSASTPVVAGLFAQLNNVRLSAGLPPLGFVNPFIYQNTDCFNDVTQGVNDGGYNWGFTAETGWDPATGVGTPNYELLAERVLM